MGNALDLAGEQEITLGMELLTWRNRDCALHGLHGLRIGKKWQLKLKLLSDQFCVTQMIVG